MTEISPTFGQTSSYTASANAQSALTSDFQTFIKMLTAQAENQDPLNPMDSAEYASQLASFSSVEQQVKTNDLLAGLAAQMGSSNLAQLSNWVGMDARSAASVRFEGDPVILHPLPARLADEAYLVVSDEIGQEVQRLAVALDGKPIEWAGVSANGSALPAGSYRFEVENYAQGALLGNSPVESYQRVEEAQMIDGQIILLLQGGGAISPEDVIGLRS
jgi:flagellar basal-body rod modification protein FlgD